MITKEKFHKLCKYSIRLQKSFISNNKPPLKVYISSEFRRFFSLISAFLKDLEFDNVNNSSAVQIHEKVNTSIFVNGSLYKTIPIIKVIVGAMYCKTPTINSGILCAPLAKSSKGTAVATPAPIKSKFVVT